MAQVSSEFSQQMNPRILIIVDPQIPVPPTTYGGIERIVQALCSELSKRGNTVDLIAGPGSRSFGGNIYIHRAPGKDRFDRALRKVVFQIISFMASRRSDVIINFGRLDYLETIVRTKVPLLICFQNPVVQFEVDWVLRRRKSSVRFVGISLAQVQELKPENRITVIHNATDVDLFTPSVAPDQPPYLAFLGRITYNKGADTAIRIARRCGLKLKLAGNISNEEGGAEFFEREIRPQLGSQIEWIGPVDDDAKHKLLAGAVALLFPIRWPEPFGIVMVESLACGTPVIATRCASTPEVIDDGVTGFLCDDEDEMVGAVAKLSTIDRSECRTAAKTKFSVEVMVQNYLRVIENLISPEAPEA